MTARERRTLARWPYYALDEIAAVTDALATGDVNYWTGTRARAFEQRYAAQCGVRYGLAVANGTVALELALRAVGIGPGDEVIVPARTFIATAAAVVACGATPVIADIDRSAQTLSAATAEAVLSPRTKAIVPVHLAGRPADMDPLMTMARTRGLAVIEDCAQAHGALDRGRPVGGIGTIGCFSFCQDKIISTGGEGGMIVTDDTALFESMWAARDHGRDFGLSRAPDPGDGFRWLTTTFGTNARMTELQAAIGLLQLEKLPEWVARRRANARALKDALAGVMAIEFPEDAAHQFNSYYRLSLLIDPAALRPGWSRNRIAAELDACGVPARVGACPDIGREAAFARNGHVSAPHPNAEWVGARSMVLPVHPTLTHDDLAFMEKCVRDVVGAASR